ncbi:MAG: hypothetical protein F6K42_05600 [Leptolyngbya sp. SIO1D8]|nr:hypothetical protein [Leptolyngbya sp. SIO1D8]
MFASLTVVSFFLVLAWTQQYFLNRLIEADRAYLKRSLIKRQDPTQ